MLAGLAPFVMSEAAVRASGLTIAPGNLVAVLTPQALRTAEPKAIRPLAAAAVREHQATGDQVAIWLELPPSAVPLLRWLLFGTPLEGGSDAG